MKNIILFLLIIVSLLTLSCQDDIMLTNSKSQKGFGNISISLKDTPAEIVEVVATLSRPEYRSKSITLTIDSLNQTASGTFNNITIGTWHLKVDAFDGNGIIKYSGETDVEIVADEISVVELVLEPSTSGVEIIVSWGGNTLSRGLVLFLPFDGDIQDKSNYRNQAHSNNAAYTADAHGTPESAYLFNGSNNYITVSNSSSLNPTKQITLSFWLRLDSIQSNYTDIFAKGGPVYGYFQNRQYNLAGKQNINLWYPQFKSAGDGKGQQELDSNEKSFNVGEWTYFTFIVDRINHKMKMYVDGVLLKEIFDSYSTFNINSYPLLIGSSLEQLYEHTPLKGAIDEFRIYNRVLSNKEIHALFNM
ncbi:MAG: LamG domain-containing protein [Ignavibacteriales bacterium]|nr:LamG domain-containing protein [Ignavibacteriales bacterium]